MTHIYILIFDTFSVSAQKCDILLYKITCLDIIFSELPIIELTICNRVN